MGDVHYMISETSKRVGVESHVLRYWEEELELPIGRTEMGHRHYTEEDIQLFCCIKELKEQGMLLKEIKLILPDILRTKKQLQEKRAAEEPSCTEQNELQLLLYPMIQSLLLENNKLLEELISTNISHKLTQEMDFLLQANSRQEEERYRKLDSLIRQQQSHRKENSRTVGAIYPFKRIFGET